MIQESAGSLSSYVPPMIVGAVTFVILVFGAVGAYLQLRRKAQPEAGQDVPQWFYVRDLVHEVRNLRQAVEAITAKQSEIASKQDAIAGNIHTLIEWLR